jgi:hypothetical protein
MKLQQSMQIDMRANTQRPAVEVKDDDVIQCKKKVAFYFQT